MLSICNPNFQIQLHGQIDWKIKNFLDWAQLKETGYKEFSSVFNFDFPEVKKSYSFSLRLDPKGEPDKEETKDEVGLYLINKNSEKLAMKYSFSLLNKHGHESEKHSSSSSFPALTGTWGWPKFTTLSKLIASPKVLLPDGCLRIHCKFTIFQGKVVQPVISPNLESPSHICLQTMKKLMTDDTFSDFKIVCDDQAFYCHKNIVAAKSDVLQQMLLSKDWSENEEEAMKIEDFDAETVRAMIHYIYTSHLPPLYSCSPRYSLSQKLFSHLAFRVSILRFLV
jgi:hypothetical protein